MIQRYILRPIGTGVIDYEAFIDETSTGGSMWAITKDFGLIKTESREKALKIRFDDLRKSYLIEYDDSKTNSAKGNFSIRDKNIEAAIPYFKKHFQTRVEGEKNPYIRGNVYFVLEHTSERSNTEARLNLQRFSVFEKFKNMTLEETADCAYFYGQNANVRHSELLNLMVGFTNGWLMRNSAYNAEDTYIEHFLNKYSVTNVTEQKVWTSIKKAIMTGDITKKQDGYYLDDTFLGVKNQNDQAVFDKLSTDERLYTALLKKMKQGNQIDDDLASTKTPKTINDTIIDRVKEDEIRAYAKAVGVSTSWKKLIPNLITEMKEMGLEAELIKKGFIPQEAELQEA